MPMPSDFATRLNLLSADLFADFLLMETPLRLRYRSAAIQEYNVAFGRFISSAMVFTDGHPGFFMRSRKESLRVVSVVFFGHESPLSAPNLGVES